MKIVEEEIEVHSIVHSTSGVKGVCWNFGMGIRMNDKRVNYSHKFAQTKRQVG